MQQPIKIKWGIKLFAFVVILLCIAISMLGIFDKGYDITERICIIVVGVVIGMIWLVWFVYLLRYKIVIVEDQFTVRVFFKTRIYHISEITNIVYKRMAFGDYTYVVKFDNGKMEVSSLLKDKYTIDKKLDDSKIFEKYPRIPL